MQVDLVMKFGGTSVGSPEALERVIAHVAREVRGIREGGEVVAVPAGKKRAPAPLAGPRQFVDPSEIAPSRRPLVVVSAVGGVTDLLLKAARLAAGGDPYDDPLAEIGRRHGTIADAFGIDGADRPASVRAQLRELDETLARLLQGVSMLREITPRIRDEIVSIGERTSVRLVAGALERRGLPARAYDAWELGLTTDEQHGRAEPLPDSRDAMAAALERLDGGIVPVVNGFIARSARGAITTLGRGGSDFSASLFGAAAGAGEIQIWTDVPGIMRADPRHVDGPAVIPEMRFDEAAELAFFGAKVLHPRAVEPARRTGIPVRVLGTFHVDPADPTPVCRQGTLIDDRVAAEPVRGLSIREGVGSLHVQSLRMLEAHGFLARVFEVLARHRISVDVVATSEVSVSMTLDCGGEELGAAVSEISAFAEVEHVPERSILCVVGAGLREDTSILARVFTTLAAARVPVRVISQGASRINITLVTDPPDAAAAMRALHQEFFRDTSPPRAD